MTREKNTNSQKNFLADCPVCHGTGLLVKRGSTEDSKEVYGERAVIDYAVPCPACNGGFVGKVKSLKAHADIPSAFYDRGYQDFLWGAYKSEGKKIDLSDQRRFVDSFVYSFEKWEEKGLGLYIWGKTKGCGKTFLASCISNELMTLYAVRAKFVSCTSLLDLAKSCNPEGRSDFERDPIGVLCSCRVLVLDDLGQKNTGTDWLTDILFRITDARMQKKRVTIITSNIKLSELNFEDRVVDRLYKLCQPIPLPDYCFRTKEANAVKQEFFHELGLL